MARRKYGKKRRSSRGKAIPLAVAIPVAMLAYDPLKAAMAGNVGEAMLRLRKNVTGVEWNGSFNAGNLLTSYGPVLVGAIVHKGANKFGINNYARKLSMGFLSI